MTTPVDDSASRWSERPAAQGEGLEAGQLMIFLFGLLALLALGVWGSTFWFQREANAANQRAAAQAHYPELEQTEIHARSMLGHYRLIDDADSLFRIPIDRAIEVLMQQPASDTALTPELRF